MPYNITNLEMGTLSFFLPLENGEVKQEDILGFRTNVKDDIVVALRKNPIFRYHEETGTIRVTKERSIETTEVSGVTVLKKDPSQPVIDATDPKLTKTVNKAKVKEAIDAETVDKNKKEG
jgi:hypothetical protein